MCFLPDSFVVFSLTFTYILFYSLYSPDFLFSIQSTCVFIMLFLHLSLFFSLDSFSSLFTAFIFLTLFCYKDPLSIFIYISVILLLSSSSPSPSNAAIAVVTFSLFDQIYLAFLFNLTFLLLCTLYYII